MKNKRVIELKPPFITIDDKGNTITPTRALSDCATELLFGPPYDHWEANAIVLSQALKYEQLENERMKLNELRNFAYIDFLQKQQFQFIKACRTIKLLGERPKEGEFVKDWDDAVSFIKKVIADKENE